MKLRIAKKIMQAVGTPDEARYSDFQIGKANARYRKTRSHKEAEQFFLDLMARMGPSGRADLLTRSGRPDMAFELLMREDGW